MKKNLLFLTLIISGINFSCKKEEPCEGCINGNRPPVANAGPDQVIILPLDSTIISGAESKDPDGTIGEWLWKKISGPASFNIVNPTSAKTVVKDLNIGVYLFELTVTDSGGLTSRDTTQVTVNVKPPPPPDASCPPTNRSVVNAQLIPVGNLSLARDGIAMVSAGNKLFFAGGHSASGRSSRVDILDLTTNTWSIAELSVARDRLSAVSSGNKVFFAGGFSSRVDIYDLTTQTWSIAELSQARDYIETATVGNKVFFAGGISSNPDTDSEASSRVDIYDLTTQNWSTTELSQARAHISAVTADNKIYFAGGDPEALPWSEATNRIDIYDNTSGMWSTSTLTERKSLFAGIYKNGKIYWAGGASTIGPGDFEIPSCKVEIRDNSGNIIDSAHLYRPISNIRGFEKDNKILYLQHFGPNNSYFDIQDLTSNTWSTGVLNQSGIYPTANILSHNNVIYVAGGWHYTGLYSNQVWKLEL